MATKAREIREILKDNTDPRVIKFLCMLADDAQQSELAVNEIAKLIDMLTTNVQNIQNAMSNIVGVLDNMPQAVKILNRIRKGTEDQGGDDGHGSN